MDLYFFIEPVTLKVGKEEVKLSSYSYVVSKYRKSVTYYDKKSDTIRTIESEDDDAKVENDFYRIYIGRDMIDYQGSNVILTSDLKQLNGIEKKG